MSETIHASHGSPRQSADIGMIFALPWMEQLIIPNDVLNIEHRGVLQKLNGLLLALQFGEPYGIITACGSLSSEAREHFATEAELMRSVDYPDTAAHLEQHERLLGKIGQMRVALTCGTNDMSSTVAQAMLEQWFVPHLTHADRQLADFVAARTGGCPGS
jgi:hemerythrin